MITLIRKKTLKLMRGGKSLLIGIIGLILTALGVIDLLATDADDLHTTHDYILQGEDSTVSYYLIIGIPLLILGVVSLVRENKKIK